MNTSPSANAATLRLFEKDPRVLEVARAARRYMASQGIVRRDLQLSAVALLVQVIEDKRKSKAVWKAKKKRFRALASS